MSDHWPTLAAALVLTGLVACGDSTGPGDNSRVRVAFAAAPSQLIGGELLITGANGTLKLTDVRLIVSEFELEGPHACAHADDEGDDELEECEFESAPFLLDLSLDGSDVVVATAGVPPGSYTRLKFEVEDLDVDEDDDAATSQAVASLVSQLRAVYPDFPHDASIVVKGEFTPVGGAARPFTVYLNADVEVKSVLDPPLVMTQDGASRLLSVKLDPTRWFLRSAQVLDLSAWNGRVLEFEHDFELGVRGVEEKDD